MSETATRLPNTTHLSGGLLTLLLILPAAWYFGLSGGAATVPQSIREVTAIAEQRGLYHRSDRADGLIDDRLVVSELPISYERARSMLPNQLNHPNWIGTVIVSAYGREMAPNYVPGHSVIWGRLFVHGDPETVRKLTGLTPQ